MSTQHSAVSVQLLAEERQEIVMLSEAKHPLFAARTA